jgi:hypothetical protein
MNPTHLEGSTMSDEHTTDAAEDKTTAGPRQQTDQRTSSDAGLTGDEGIQVEQPAPQWDSDEDDH